MSELIISVSGLRGIVGETLTPEVATRYVCAFAATLASGPIVVTRDGRATGRMLTDVIRGGLAAVGRDVVDADIAATPTTGVLVRELRAAGGIQISASHNPAEYNGLKLFSPQGRVITADAGNRVIEQYRGSQPVWVTHEAVGRCSEPEETESAHCQLVLKTVDVERIRAQKFRVLLDSNHGAGSLLGRRLLEELGCRLTVLGGDADGQFEHPPEPTAANLKEAARAVTDDGADVGFFQDPDADRLALVDAAGRYVGEENTLAVCVDHVLRHSPGPIVTNCSTSRMSEDLAAKYGVPFFRAAVGEANVVTAMESKNAVLGGEGNGGVIDPRVGMVRDSFVGMALVLDAMAARGLSLADLVDELPRYEIVKSKVSLPPDKVACGLEALAIHFQDATSDRMDGLRFDWPGRWLLVRASNTEPIVRAVAEAETAAVAQELCTAAAEVLSSV